MRSYRDICEFNNETSLSNFFLECAITGILMFIFSYFIDINVVLIPMYKLISCIIYGIVFVKVFSLVPDIYKSIKKIFKKT